MVMAAIVGFVMIAALVVALLKFKMLPITFFATVPFLAAVVLGFGVTEIFTMTAKGVIGVLPTATLFVFSITYFGIMSDAGLFDRPVNWLLKHMKANVFGVLTATVLVAMISHLDGSGTTTVMITVPAMIPIANKLKVRKLPVAFLMTMTISVMNLLPWGGPLGRAAVVVGAETTALWRTILPVQIFGIVLLFVTAWLVAKSEEKLGFAAQPYEGDLSGGAAASGDLVRPKLFWANLVLTVIVIVLLFLGCPAFLPFMIGLAIALPMNYGKDGDRAMTARIKAHAGDVVPMILTIMGAGIFLGVLQNAGIIDAMATAIVSVIPNALGGVLHAIFGLLAMPMSLVLDADSMNLGILPFIVQAGQNYGVSPEASALAIAIGHNTGIGFCMTNASVYFALGLLGLEYSDSLKYCFLKAMAFGTAMVLFGLVIGVL